MRSRKLALSLLAVLATLVSGAVLADELAPLDVFAGPPIAAGQEFDISAYYPMGVGYSWKYQDTADNNVQFKMEIKRKVAANGKQAYLFERSTKVETDVVTAEADGMLLHAQQRTNRDGSVMQTTWTPPVKFSNARTKVGAQVATTPGFINPGTGNTMTWTSTVAGVQDVQVGTAKFTNCPRIRVLVTDTKLGVKLSEFEMWLGHKIGVVKRQGNFFGVYFAQNLLEWKAQ